MRIVIHPARYRISTKGQNERGDGMIDFRAAGAAFISMVMFLIGSGMLRLQSGR
jgi:hypothetical protein